MRSFKSQVVLLFTAKEKFLGGKTINISFGCSNYEIVVPKILREARKVSTQI